MLMETHKKAFSFSSPLFALKLPQPILCIGRRDAHKKYQFECKRCSYVPTTTKIANPFTNSKSVVTFLNARPAFSFANMAALKVLKVF